MKKMKRILVALLSCITAFACVAGLSACGKEEKKGNSQDIIPPASSVEQESNETDNSSESSVHVCTWDEGVVTTAPTCVNPGEKTYSCACGETKVEPIEADGVSHTEVEIPAVPATCTEAGLTAGKKCSACETVTVAQEEVAATGHTYNEGVVTTAPTCTEKGVKTFTCACGDSYTEEVAALGHTEKTIAAVPATCQTTGWTEGKECSVCDVVLVAPVATEKADHNAVEFGAKAATCTTAGVKAGTKCKDCGALLTETEIIEAFGHTEVIIPGEEATCGKEGKTEGKKCSVCNEVLVAQTTIPMTTEHNYVETVVKAATCEVAGEKTSKCSICGDEKAAEVIPALGHVWSEEDGKVALAATCVAKGLWEVPCVRTFEDGTGCKEEGRKVTDIEINPKNHADLVVLPAVAANCENTGLTEGKKCEACDVVTVEQIVTEKAGHVWNEGEVTTAPTCTEEGVKTFTCTVCGETKEEVLKAEGHAPEAEWKMTKPGIPANCGIGLLGNGKTPEYSCPKCGTKMAGGEVIEGGHIWVTKAEKLPTCTEAGWKEGIECTRCGKVKVEAVEATGHTSVVDEKVEPNCATMESGWTEGSHCGVCNVVLVAQEEIKAAHVWEIYEGLLPNCTEAGYQGYKVCTVCEGMYDMADNKIDAPVVIAPIGHVASGYTVATCTTPRTCAECGAAFGRALGHNWGMYKYDEEVLKEVGLENILLALELDQFGYPVFVKDAYMPAIPADCTQVGCNAFMTCDRCGDLALVDEEGNITETNVPEEEVIIPAMSVMGTHTLTTVAGFAPSCKEAGAYAYAECSVCGYVVVNVEDTKVEYFYGSFDKTDANENGIIDAVEIEALGHDFENGTEVGFVAATCVAYSETEIKCARCDATTVEYGTEFDLVNGHNKVQKGTGYKATCTEDGVYGHKQCTLCETYFVDIRTEEVEIAKDEFTEEALVEEALDHDFLNGTVLETVAPTCVAKGTTKYQCVRCTETWVDEDVAIDPTAHNKVQKGTGYQATCTDAGVYGYKQCTLCETYFVDVRTEELEIAKEEFSEEMLVEAALGHDFENGAEVARTEATCQAAGSYTKNCVRFDACGESKTFEIAIVAHDYVTLISTVPATCTEEGLETYACKYAAAGCTETMEKPLPVDTVNGHDWEVFHEDATCAKYSRDGEVCKICGEEQNVVIGTEYDATKHFNKLAEEGRVCAALVICDAEGCGQYYENTKAVEHTYNVLGNCIYCEAKDGLKPGNDCGIYSVEQLWQFAESVNGGESYYGCTVTLKVDIDLENAAWTPIGAAKATPFKGTFDGNGKTISNLNVTADVAAGLFGYVVGTVENLTVVGAKVNSTHYAGVIAAHAYGYFYNCTVKNAEITCVDTVVDADMDGDKAGAIVGFLASDGLSNGEQLHSTVKGCVAENVKITANRDAGALVGCTHTTAYVKAEENTFTGIEIVWSNYGTGANLKADETVGSIR